MPWTLIPRRVRIKGPVGAKNALTVLFRQTLQRTVRYLWSISEVLYPIPIEYLYQSTGLFESSALYSSIAKYRPNEVPLGDFNYKIKHENVDKMN